MTALPITPEQLNFSQEILNHTYGLRTGIANNLEVVANKVAARDIEIIAQALAEQAQQIDLEAFPQILRDAAAERRRQVEAENFTLTHDDTQVGGELALAAAGYAIPPWFRTEFGGIFNIWPWHRNWWKPERRKENRRREIVKAIALLTAEADRLEREKSAVGDLADHFSDYLMMGAPFREGAETKWFYRFPESLGKHFPTKTGGLWSGERTTFVSTLAKLESSGWVEASITTATPLF